MPNKHAEFLCQQTPEDIVEELQPWSSLETLDRRRWISIETGEIGKLESTCEASRRRGIKYP